MRPRLLVGIPRQASLRVQRLPHATRIPFYLYQTKSLSFASHQCSRHSPAPFAAPHLPRSVTCRTMATSDSTPSSTAPNPTAGPLELSIHSKILNSLNPTKLVIANDSHKHAHHAAMATVSTPVTERETHFRVEIVSDSFEGQRQPARHRAVYALCKEELGMEGGVHALQISARTPEEDEKRRQNAASAT